MSQRNIVISSRGKYLYSCLFMDFMKENLSRNDGDKTPCLLFIFPIAIFNLFTPYSCNNHYGFDAIDENLGSR